MSNTYFISDTHFFHRNIIDYCGRPFKSEVEMNDTIIRRWNIKVEKTDTIFHLGDFSLCTEALTILEQLNGKKFLVPGNHDKAAIRNSTHWVDICPDIQEIRIGEDIIILCHYPLESWNKKFHNSIHLHGHIHLRTNSHNKQVNRYDVGVDANNFTPVSFHEIKHFLNKKINSDITELF